jgi:hypothetical protein
MCPAHFLSPAQHAPELRLIALPSLSVCDGGVWCGLSASGCNSSWPWGVNLQAPQLTTPEPYAAAGSLCCVSVWVTHAACCNSGPPRADGSQACVWVGGIFRPCGFCYACCADSRRLSCKEGLRTITASGWEHSAPMLKADVQLQLRV